MQQGTDPAGLRRSENRTRQVSITKTPRPGRGAYVCNPQGSKQVRFCRFCALTCKTGGVVATETEDGAHSSTVNLGWQMNTGGDFRQNAAHQKGISSVDDQVQAVIILGIPT